MTSIDPHGLKPDQYATSTNLDARLALHARFSTNKYGWHRWVFDQFELAPDARILEIGCGPGTLWRENVDRLPSSWTVTLTDFSPGMLADAAGNLGAVDALFRYAAADARTLPFESDAFDAVVANHMLYHVPNRPQALAEIRRVLRPGGRLYASTNGAAHLVELRTLVGETTSRAHAPFTLENGVDQVAAAFGGSDVRLYEDGLEVTEAEPLVAYIRSWWAIDENRLRSLESEIERRIAVDGCIRITKSAGLIRATK